MFFLKKKKKNNKKKKFWGFKARRLELKQNSPSN